MLQGPRNATTGGDRALTSHLKLGPSCFDAFAEPYPVRGTTGANGGTLVLLDLPQCRHMLVPAGDHGPLPR